MAPAATSSNTPSSHSKCFSIAHMYRGVLMPPCLNILVSYFYNNSIHSQIFGSYIKSLMTTLFILLLSQPKYEHNSSSLLPRKCAVAEYLQWVCMSLFHTCFLILTCHYRENWNSEKYFVHSHLSRN